MLAFGLGDFPESGQRSDKIDARIVFSPRYPYRIYYRIASGEVLILHIRHAARRPLEAGEV
jgi:toxin ParE1/3/4